MPDTPTPSGQTPAHKARNSARLSHSTLASLSGTILEQRYELETVLGAGGMGAVFKARHLRLDRTVAIKVLRPMLADHDEYITRFLREAKAASTIRHRNIVEVLDYGEAADGLLYSVMEFLVGQDLEALLRSQPDQRLPWDRTREILIQVASGLRAAHRSGIIHRDIKPANCFLTSEDDQLLVKVVDFGIAKVEGTDQGRPLTATDQVIGTPSYIAPELIRVQSPPSPRSDIYSLGILAYRMLAGREPFRGNSPAETCGMSCYEAVPPLSEHVPDVPEPVEALVLEMLAKTPAERPRDMSAVRQRLLDLEHPEPRTMMVPAPAPGSAEHASAVEEPSPSTEQTTVPRKDARSKAPSDPITRVDAGAMPPPDARPPLRDERSAEIPKASHTLEVPPEAVPEDAPAPPPENRTLEELESPPNAQNTSGLGKWLMLGAVATAVAVALFPVILIDSGETSAEHAPGATTTRPAPPADTPLLAKADLRPTSTVNGSTPKGPAVDYSPSGPVEADTKLTEATTDTPTPDPITPTQAAVATPNETKVKAKARRKKSSKPPVVTHEKAENTSELSASDVKSILRKKIKSACAQELGTEVVSVAFLLYPDGAIRSLNTIPRKGAGECAYREIRGTTFPPRSTRIRISFKVEG